MNFESLKCVWMSSGVVDYKLCDKNFNCDHCQFDKTIRLKSDAVQAVERNGIMAKLQHSMQEDASRGECLFIRDFLMLRRLHGNSYFIGFTNFFRECLSPAQTILVEMKKGFIPKGKPAFQVKRGTLSWDITLPFDCHLLSSVLGQFHAAQSSEWLGLIEAEQETVEAEAVAIPDYRKCAERSLKDLAFEVSYDEAGLTMYDGGTMVETLAEALGPEKFSKFILSICGDRI